MKYILLAIIFLAIVSLVACSTPSSAQTQTTANSMATASLIVPTATTPAQTTTTDTNGNEEVEIRDLVENFGKRLQNISLQASDAAQEMQKEYSDFVSPALLETWMNDASKAPGRIVSSPWPDRIEITTLAKEGADKYAVTGFVIDITSTEVNSGGAAAKRPVRIVLQKEQGRWLITEYTEER